MAKRYVYVYCWVTEDSYVGSYVLDLEQAPEGNVESILDAMWLKDYGNQNFPEWECVHRYVKEVSHE